MRHELARAPHNFLSRLWRLMGSIIAIFGASLLAFVGYEYYYGRLSSNWPETPGELKIFAEQYYQGERTRYANSLAVGSERHISYRYRVAGKQYTGNRISFGRGQETPGLTTNGPAAVTVHYNPVRPSQSVLFPGYSGLPWVMILYGVGSIGTGFVIFKIGGKLT